MYAGTWNSLPTMKALTLQNHVSVENPKPEDQHSSCANATKMCSVCFQMLGCNECVIGCVTKCLSCNNVMCKPCNNGKITENWTCNFCVDRK